MLYRRRWFAESMKTFGQEFAAKSTQCAHLSRAGEYETNRRYSNWFYDSATTDESVSRRNQRSPTFPRPRPDAKRPGTRPGPISLMRFSLLVMTVMPVMMSGGGIRWNNRAGHNRKGNECKQ